MSAIDCPECNGTIVDEDHRGNGHQPSPNALKELVAEYDSGATIRALASKYGVHYGIVRRRLIRGGATIRPKGGNHR
jgi:transposase-like protein